MAELEFFSPEWAAAVRDALTAGLFTGAGTGGQAAGVLGPVRLHQERVPGVLGSRLPRARRRPGRGIGRWAAYLFVQWSGGTVTDCRIIGPDEPLAATYVLAMDYADWQALHDGYDAQRTVMYRKILLEEGNLLEFFKAIYFFVECLSIIGAVPARYPALSQPQPRPVG